MCVALPMDYHTELFLHNKFTIGPLGSDDHMRVISVLRHASKKWFELGLELGFDRDYLEDIKCDDTVYTEMGFLSIMLREWLKGDLEAVSPPCWNAIVRALESEQVGKSEIAEAVRHANSVSSKLL